MSLRPVNRDRPLILIVEDDAQLRTLLRIAIQNSDYDVAEAEDGLSALDSFHLRRPDAILLDVMMPDMDGFQVCEAVRATPHGKNIPVIMMTGLDDTDSIDRAYEIGATDFITKPINHRILSYRLRNILRASRAETQFATTLAHLKDAIECFPAAFYLYDSDDCLLVCNKVALADTPEIADYLVPGTRYDAIARALADAGLIDAAVGRPEQWLQQRRAERLNASWSHTELHSNGRWYKVIERHTTNGGALAMHLDITDVINREQALRAAKESAEIADRAKSEFLANMSHELRTPLNAIIGFSDILKDEILGPLGNEQYGTYATDINDAGRHLVHVINDILDIAKAESGRLDLIESDIDLADSIGSTLRMLQLRADDAKVTLECHLPAAPAIVHADARKMKQILINLMSNAIKFTPEGGRVDLTLRRDSDGAMIIEVTDTGIGMAQEDIPRALMPFVQVDGRLCREYEGTGLGLPLVVAMVECHGGKLDLESELDQGTKVTIRLPAERVLGAAALPMAG